MSIELSYNLAMPVGPAKNDMKNLNESTVTECHELLLARKKARTDRARIERQDAKVLASNFDLEMLDYCNSDSRLSDKERRVVRLAIKLKREDARRNGF